MSELHTETIKTPKKKTKKAKPVVTKDNPFAGITANACPTACTPARCVISTVGICKHPYKSSVNGCGPRTMENRDKAKKLIKHQMVDLKG